FLFGLLLLNNGTYGLDTTQYATGALLIHCNIYGNGLSGIRLRTIGGSSASAALLNSSLVNNGAYAVEMDDGATLLPWSVGLHTHNNTSGISNKTIDVPLMVTGDPLFEDPGSFDFTPDEYSPLVGAGYQ